MASSPGHSHRLAWRVPPPWLVGGRCPLGLLLAPALCPRLSCVSVCHLSGLLSSGKPPISSPMRAASPGDRLLFFLFSGIFLLSPCIQAWCFLASPFLPRSRGPSLGFPSHLPHCPRSPPPHPVSLPCAALPASPAAASDGRSAAVSWSDEEGFFLTPC